MQAQEIGVVVTDVEVGHEDIIGMLKLLKLENPQILAVVLTNASDSEMAIHLINEAQIFRFLDKPVNVKLLKHYVEAALVRYLAFRQTPQLLRQHRVQDSRELRESSVGQKVVAGLKVLRGRWFESNKKP
jgi:serine/threonine-protein kinase